MAHEQPGQSLMIEQFLKTAQSQIKGPLGGTGFSSPQVEQAYSKWLNQALPQLYKGIDEGKSIAELTKEGSPLMDSIEKAKPTLADRINDKSTPNTAKAFSFNINNYDITSSQGIEAARQAITQTYQNSSKTARDWDKAHEALSKLPSGPQVPMSNQ
jgi:hypothetical protein